MAILVIDTDVWSYLYKERDEAKLYEQHFFGNILVISFQTEAELLHGVLSANWEKSVAYISNRDSESTSSSVHRVHCRYVGRKRWRALGATAGL